MSYELQIFMDAFYIQTEHTTKFSSSYDKFKNCSIPLISKYTVLLDN